MDRGRVGGRHRVGTTPRWVSGPEQQVGPWCIRVALPRWDKQHSHREVPEHSESRLKLESVRGHPGGAGDEFTGRGPSRAVS